MFRLVNANSWMWSEALAALERAERSQRQLWGAAQRVQHRTTWEPQVDVFETASGFHVVVALPGIRSEQVSLLIDDSSLVISTQRVATAPQGALRVRRLEIPYGLFVRRITLPPGRYVLLEQRMADGCLELLVERQCT